MMKLTLGIATFLFSFCAAAIKPSGIPISECMTDECVKFFNDYKLYAKQGHAEAMFALGEFYFHGYGTAKNLEKAFVFYKKSARYGSRNGQVKTALMALNFPGFEDLELGIRNLKKATRQKHANSAYLLGIIYLDDEFGKKDLEQADKWLSYAHKYGSEEATKVIKDLAQSRLFSKIVFPKLASITNEYEADNNEKVPSSTLSKVPDENYEVITVIAPDLKESLTVGLTYFKNAEPQRFKTATGSRLPGRTCADIQGCTVINDSVSLRRYLGR